MPSQSLLQILGAKGQKEARYAPIFTDRYFVGYWSNRNPLRSPLSTFYADGWHLGGTDAILSGENIELSPRLTLCRRPGNLAYSTATFPTPPLTFYPFEKFGASVNSIDVIVDTDTQIYTLTPTAKTSIFTKAANAGQANFLGIGQTLYFGDGAEVKAWQNGLIRNWGISIGSSVSAYAGTAANIAYGGNAWANPNNALGPPDSVYAVATQPSDLLLLTGYGFSFTTAVTGVTVTVTGFGSIHPSTSLFNIALTLDGSIISTTKTGNFPDSPTTAVFGGSSDTWGITLTAAIVNDPTFGVAMWGTGPLGQFDIDAAQIALTGPTGPTVSLVPGGFSPAPTVGYMYVFAYCNSVSGGVSSASPPSALILPDGTTSVQIDLVPSSDPQVNQIWLFRTADGGSTYLNVPGSPFSNTAVSFTDNAPDAQLNILQQAPVNFVNNPPLAQSLDPVYYLGLVWVHSANAVYFSRVASAVVGVTQESFPPGNVFTFPETVIRKVATSAGLIILTTANIYIILGNNTSSSILYSTTFLTGYGIQSWNALWVDGSIIYFFTSDNRMIELNPSSGVTDLGFPIGDQLASLNPANVYVTYNSTTSNDVALYIGDGSTGWYRCNPYQAPDQAITGPVWSPKAFISGGVKALVGMQTAPGVHQLMIGSSFNNNAVLVRDSTYTTFTDNGVSYPADFIIGSIVLAQPGQMAICRFVTCDFIRVGTSPVVFVLLGEISGPFENISGYTVPDPPYVAASTSLYNNRYYFKQTGIEVGGIPGPVVCRHMQFRIDFGADIVQNELLSSTINGSIYHEK